MQLTRNWKYKKKAWEEKFRNRQILATFEGFFHHPRRIPKSSIRCKIVLVISFILNEELKNEATREGRVLNPSVVSTCPLFNSAKTLAFIDTKHRKNIFENWAEITVRKI